MDTQQNFVLRPLVFITWLIFFSFGFVHCVVTTWFAWAPEHFRVWWLWRWGAPVFFMVPGVSPDRRPTRKLRPAVRKHLAKLIKKKSILNIKKCDNFAVLRFHIANDSEINVNESSKYRRRFFFFISFVRFEPDETETNEWNTMKNGLSSWRWRNENYCYRLNYHIFFL